MPRRAEIAPRPVTPDPVYESQLVTQLQNRGRTLALRWLVTYSRDRREKHMADKLAGEILDALEQQGNAFKRKDDMYRMAQANKAFAHYRW